MRTTMGHFVGPIVSRKYGALGQRVPRNGCKVIIVSVEVSSMEREMAAPGGGGWHGV